MTPSKPTQAGEIIIADSQWQGIYRIGAISAMIALAGILLDVVIGSISGGNLSALPQSAAGRFVQFQDNPWLGLYNLDLLNMVNQIIMIPAYFALYAAQRKSNNGYALLAMLVFLVGSTILITNNTALPMFELSRKYALAASETQKSLYAAAGEAMLARGAHGSLGAFPGFLLPNIAGLIMSLAMLSGKVFSKLNAWLGIAGSILILLYIILVAFAPVVRDMATTFAMPGGLLLITWMVLFIIKLFQLSSLKNK